MKHNNFTTSGNGKKKLYPIYKILLFISLQDRQIEHDKQTYSIFGGCAVIVALFLLGKLYVANAGDCRYINFVEIIQNLNNLILPFIFDFIDLILVRINLHNYSPSTLQNENIH
jgi:hypothetical protein